VGAWRAGFLRLYRGFDFLTPLSTRAVERVVASPTVPLAWCQVQPENSRVGAVVETWSTARLSDTFQKNPVQHLLTVAL
jgi:hypothetical protein